MASKLARLSLTVLSVGVIVWPARASLAEQSSPLADVPQDVQSITPILRHVVAVFESSQAAQQRVKQLRIEQDAVKTKLTSVNGEFQVTGQQQEQLGQELRATEAEQQARLESLRKDLESRLEEELGLTRRQIADEQEGDFARRVETFESHQREAIGNALDQEFQLKARELQQLSQEIEAQTQELAGRLARLDASSDVANALQRSTSETLTNRRAELEARRAQLAPERDALLGKQRDEFTVQLKQQQVADQQRRLILKEASLRQAMAELLHKTDVDGGGRAAQLRQALDDVAGHLGQLTQQQAALNTRVEALGRELASNVHRLGELGADRQTSLSRLEEAFQKAPSGLRPEALRWFGRTIQQSMPPELATDLGAIHQRLLVRAQQERQLAGQRRVLRERQLAMQLSQEMESEFHQAELRQQRDQEARARKADELLGKAEQLAGRGRYDDALQLIAQAQALPPPQMSRVAILREQIVTAKDEATRQAQTAQIEQSFARAMEVFKQGRYEDAIGLFEQVIAQEATQGGESSVQLANRKGP